MTKAIPEGYQSVTPHLVVDDGKAAIDFYIRAFGATEMFRLPIGEGIAHAEIRIGNSVVMLAEETPGMDLLSPKSRGGCTSSLMVYVEDVDAAFAQAIAAGGTVERHVQDQFYGDRAGTLVDPSGHRWTLATHIEDVSEDELRRRVEAMT